MYRIEENAGSARNKPFGQVQDWVERTGGSMHQGEPLKKKEKNPLVNANRTGEPHDPGSRIKGYDQSTGSLARRLQ